jgi:serine/threonine-protein kinase
VEDLQAILPDRFDFERALSALACAGMIDRGPKGFRWSHPLLREVTVASTPSAVRRDLNAKAYDIAEARELPLEVRAAMSFQAERDMEAMFLLEQVADRAAQRGDDEGAILALRTGLEAARRDGARGNLDDPTETLLVFGRKLGDALLRAGQLMQADSLLREMLEVAGPHSPSGISILRGLARVERAEARSGEAHTVVVDSARNGQRKLGS